MSDVVSRSYPKWEHLIGLRCVEDVGNGMGLRLTWQRAIPTDQNDVVYYNIYYANTRFDVFDEGPKAITTETSVILNTFTPGKLNYLAVRAVEFGANDIDVSKLTQIGENVYSYPTRQTLTSEIQDGYFANVFVEDNSEYPDSGFVLVGTEIMQYVVSSTNVFYVETEGRGYLDSVIESHEIGEQVSLWHGIEDDNTHILLATAAWVYENGTPRNVDAIGEVNVDEDGYRAANEDNINTNLTSADENNSDFVSYDYCGYHRPSLQETFRGDACLGSYLGGKFDGGRGFNFQDRNLAQLESMIQVTGEPIILLKRKWTGKRCSCITLQREHQRSRCPKCFNVGFEGGYDRYVNTRSISESFVNTQGYIMVRIEPFEDNVELTLDQGLRQKVEIGAWTIAVPTIKVRDVLLALTEDMQINFAYEVISVTRNKLFFGQTGKQSLKIKRLDYTDEIYTYPNIII